MYLRERETLSTVSYFLSKQIIALLDLVALPFFYALPILVLTKSDVHFINIYVSFMLLHWVAAGVSQLLSLTVGERVQLLLAAIVPLF